MKTRFLTKLQKDEIYSNSLVSIGIIVLLGEVIWLTGPYLRLGSFAPLAQTDKRIYIILSIFLAWLLKFLIIDLDAPNPFMHKDSRIRKKLQEVQSRFQGALQFLKKTTISRHGRTVNLSDLPWYLLIGPPGSGKTTLLASSGVNFILQKQFQNQDLLNISPSENCDWWITRETSIIDVPGKYLLNSEDSKNSNQAFNAYPVVWQFFLRLIRKQRGKNGINGIIVTLPAAEIMKLDSKEYQLILRDIFQRMHEIQKTFHHPISCQIIITKCDLLPGFSEFFAESSNEETSQAWGITFPALKEGDKIADMFIARFNALIKKLNDQLIWRLHQERNPMARPYIKDFPLQVERVKEFLIDFIKKLQAARLDLALQGIYLTSALQPKPETEGNILDQPLNNTARAIQIFKEPTLASRAYFIKQFFTHGIGYTHVEHALPGQAVLWKRRTAYAASASLIVLAAVMLGKDFQKGVNQAYAIQNNISDYQLRIAQIQDPDEHLAGTIRFLNTLHHAIRESGFKFDLSHLLSFYSYKSQQKTNEVYQQALRTILIPEIKNYFEYYLQTPINKNADDVYSVLKAYIEIGDPSHFDAAYVSSTFHKILPKTLQGSESSDLIVHVNNALNSTWSPITLNTKTVDETRKYLSSLPGLKLSYIILKNIDSNNAASEINIGTSNNQITIFTAQVTNQVPAMFTAKAFATVVSQDAAVAAQEATSGNWVLGDDSGMSRNSALAAPLVEQLRTAYVNNYVDVWESLLANIHLTTPGNLVQTDNMIRKLISSDSPLLELLQTLHDNTYFEPIASSSPKLQSLGLLVEKNTESQNQLYEIFASLQGLHQYLQSVIGSANEKKAAFDLVSNRMLGHGTPDAITQLRLVAEKSPEPIKNWLDKIANDSWNFLMQDAGHYIDTSWQNKVIHYYQADISNHYPFSSNSDREVDIQKFTSFFGNSGVVTTFYNTILRPFIDTSAPEWHWKKLDNEVLPFSEETLRQIQHAMRINHAFFPNGDNKLFVQFSLQPYKFGKLIKKVRLSINDKQFIDDNTNLKNTHIISWPSNNFTKMTSLQMTMANKQTLTRNYPGNWGWFKLVSQSFESMISKKEILINLSLNEHPVKYILYTDSQYNPFLSLNMRHFRLPQQLTDEKA